MALQKFTDRNYSSVDFNLRRTYDLFMFRIVYSVDRRSVVDDWSVRRHQNDGFDDHFR